MMLSDLVLSMRVFYSVLLLLTGLELRFKILSGGLKWLKHLSGDDVGIGLNCCCVFGL